MRTERGPVYCMGDWSDAEEVQGRSAFSVWRLFQHYPVAWDWADMADWERRQWVEHAKDQQRDPALSPATLRQRAVLRAQ